MADGDATQPPVSDRVAQVGEQPEARLAHEIRRRREAAELSHSELANIVGYSREYVSRAERPSKGLASPGLVAAIDAALQAEGALVALRARLQRQREHRRVVQAGSPGPESPGLQATSKADDVGAEWQQRSIHAEDDVVKLAASLSRSDISPETIEEIDRVVVALAEAHTSVSSSSMFDQLAGVHSRIRSLQQARLRLRHRRDLYRIHSDLLAHGCVVLGDLGQANEAERWGRAALVFAQEADASLARPCTALAKTLRWSERFAESAEMARHGLATAAPLPVRVQLASQEANAAALMGHRDRAIEALDRARALADATSEDSGVSAWSFPPARMAVFAQSVARHTGDPDTALSAAADAEARWAAGDPRVVATWAQIRLGAAMAHLDKDDLDAATELAESVLAGLTPDQRLSTVLSYVEDLMHRLAESPAASSARAVELADRCRTLTARPNPAPR
jgi:transcriptional regulator with XRE-family HTH domain